MGKRVDIETFRKDLKVMTLEETLIKHNVSFQEAVQVMPRKFSKKKVKKKLKNSGRYIQERDGKYYLRKWVTDKTLHFGTYSSLEDAQKMRELCQERGWIQEKVLDYCNELGIELATEQTKFGGEQ